MVIYNAEVYELMQDAIAWAKKNNKSIEEVPDYIQEQIKKDKEIENKSVQNVIDFLSELQ